MLVIIHRDKANSTVIGGWLKKIKPDAVTLEFSPYGLMFRKTWGAFYKKKIESILIRMRHDGQTYNEEALSFLNAYIDLPVEYKAASLYCRENNASLHLVDMDLFSYMNLRNTDELFSEDNIRSIAATRVSPASGNEKTMARLFFDSGIEMAPYTEEMRIRDRYMSRRIGMLLQDNKEERCVTHITGWQHLKDPCNIFTPFHPVKVFAYD
jgi:hypothetical protein